MGKTNAMTTISVRYWAGAQEAAGTAAEPFEAATVREALDQARARHSNPRFDQVLLLSTILINSTAAHPADLDAARDDETVVEVLPPFAGGA